jgi:hypothetical protein
MIFIQSLNLAWTPYSVSIGCSGPVAEIGEKLENRQFSSILVDCQFLLSKSQLNISGAIMTLHKSILYCVTLDSLLQTIRAVAIFDRGM